MPLILALGRLREAGGSLEFQDSQAKATQRNPVSNKQTNRLYMAN